MYALDTTTAATATRYTTEYAGSDNASYGVRYSVFDRSSRLVQKQKFFAGEKARTRWINKQELENGNFVRVDALSN